LRRVLAYRSVRDGSAIAAVREWSVRSVSLHGDRKRLPRRHRPHLGKGETTMNATRCIPFAGRLSIGLAFAMSGLSKLAAYGAMVDLIFQAPTSSAAGLRRGCHGRAWMWRPHDRRLSGAHTAGVLALFCVATALFFHTNFTDSDQIFHFIKNVVMTVRIVGG
jgi:putative oxidoreductase